MQGVHIAMAILCAWRLTELFGIDTIFAPVRGLFPNWNWYQLLWSCPRCLSVWASAIVAIPFWFKYPEYRPFLLYWPFAFSFLYLAYGRVMDVRFPMKVNAITITPTPDGLAQMNMGGYAPRVVLPHLKALVSRVEEAIAGADRNKKEEKVKNG